jgi:hypothetical protein
VALEKSHTYTSRSLFNLIDTISMVTKKDLGLKKNK